MSTISVDRKYYTLERKVLFSVLKNQIIKKSETKNFIVVGGTQLYIKALLEGLDIDINKLPAEARKEFLRYKIKLEEKRKESAIKNDFMAFVKKIEAKVAAE